MIFSWIRVEPGTPWASIESGLIRVTEPVLGPIRRIIPPMRMGAGSLDVSPLLVLVVILVIC